VALIVVEVMLKPEILDPQGQAVASALPRLGFNFAKSVRQGKRFEIEVDGEANTEAQLKPLKRPLKFYFQIQLLKITPYELRNNAYWRRNFSRIT